MDYMDLTLRCLRKAVKVTHSLPPPFFYENDFILVE